jgi:hypothetical protein
MITIFYAQFGITLTGLVLSDNLQGFTEHQSSLYKTTN